MQLSAKRIAALAALLMLAACATKPPPAPAAKAPPSAAMAPAPPPPPKVDNEVSLHSTPAGVDLSLYRRVREPVPRGAETKVVLLLHPYGVPTAAAFDVKGYSLIEYLAEHGYDVWATEYRGFGRSSSAPVLIGRNRQMIPSPRLEQSLGDVREAIDAVLSSTKAKNLTLIGYGYGGLVAGMAAAKYPDKVSRLVLYGTAFSFRVGKLGQELRLRPAEDGKRHAIDPKLPPYETVSWEDTTLKEWKAMMDHKELADPAAIQAVKDAFYTSDYVELDSGERRLRRPTGPMLDEHSVWSDKALFDAAKIRVPTLVVRGDMDPLAEPNLARKLKGTKIVREVVIKNATHWMLYEISHDEVFLETLRFLGGA